MTEDQHSFGMDQTDSDEYVSPTTVLEDFKAEATAEEEDRYKKYVVPSRPNIEAVFNPDIDYDLLRMFSKKATDRKKKEFDSLRFAFMILTHTNRGFEMRGHQVNTEAGDRMVFSSPEFVAMMGSNSPQQAIRKFYGSDGHIIATMQKVLEDAGYNDEDIEEGGYGPLGQD